jgi:predicted ATP-grasp superfamily ATP-dependent carboligase
VYQLGRCPLINRIHNLRVPAMATVLFLDTNPGGNGTRAMRHASAWGFRTQFLTRDRGEYDSLHDSPIEVADEVVVVDTLDVVKLLRLDYPEDVVATIAFDELRAIPAAVLGSYLGTAYNPPVPGLVNARFKDRLRARLAGTRHAMRHAVFPLASAPASSPIGYPCVVKPVDEAGSRGVRVCRDPSGFRAGVEALRLMTSAPYHRGYRITAVGLVEEYISGDEYSAELVWSQRDGDWRLIGFTRKHISPAPWCLEMAELFPHRFARDQHKSLLCQLRGCLKLLGLRGTVAHVEFRLTDGQVNIIDVNPRSAGDRIPDLVQHVTGVDLVALHLAAHLGTADALLDRAAPRGFAGVRYLVPPRPGTVVGFDIAPGHDGGLIDLRTVPTPVTISEVTSNSAQTVQIVAGGRSVEDVDRALAQHAARVRHCYSSSSAPASKPPAPRGTRGCSAA